MSLIKLCIISYLFVACVECLPTSKEFFQLSIVHVNDFHDRFEETNEWGDSCKINETCIGGFSRMYQTIMSLKKQNPNVLLLNAGDSFQGTVWYTIFKWKVTQYFMKKIPFHASTLGNHEFDDGVNDAANYIKGLNSPVVLSNVVDDYYPEFKKLHTKSIIIQRNEKQIGIIGVLLTEVKVKSKIEKLIFLDESESVNKEAEKLVKDSNVFTNIVLSHCGYDLDIEMAKKAKGKISIIVGGHSHSLLWNGDSPPSHAEKPEGPYPTVVTREDGKKVLIVQAQSFARYVGNITVNFDEYGDIHEWFGQPIFQDSSMAQNKEMSEEIARWKKRLDEEVDKVEGSTLTDLSSDGCKIRECSLGNLIADSMFFNELTHSAENWTNAAVALINSGGLKESIPKGNITDRQLFAAIPFKNYITLGAIEGRYLLEALEHALEYHGEWRSRLLQVSGLKVYYNLCNPEGSRLVSAKIRCAHSKIPTYSEIVPNQTYNVLMAEFLADGGDGFSMFKEHFKVIRRSGLDFDILKKYVIRKSPLWTEIEDRLQFSGGDEKCVSNSGLKKNLHPMR